MTLTPKQTRFVQEYLIDLNATAAARRAGYSAKTAKAMGCENLTKPDIQAAVAEAQDARVERTLISQDEVIHGLKAEATYKGDSASHGARVSAWAHLGKHLKMFEDKTTFDGSMTVIVKQFCGPRDPG